MPFNERDIFWDWDAACNQQDIKPQKELACYVLEDLDEVARIFHNAKSYLGDHAFYAYESDNPPQRAREEVKALYKCLQNGKPKAGGDYLAYVLEDIKSVRVRGKQRIRLAREVLFWGHGVCLDWVLLFAACVFKAHIYPLIIATSAHVILGYWLTEHDAETYGRVILSGAEIREHFSKERIKVINATRIPPNERGEPMSFDQAEDEAETHVPYALFAVDIRAAREAGIRSLLPLKPWPGNHSLPPAEHFQWRPELDKVREWWRGEDSYGVLALVGIGGAGKTAIVHRFLAQLPGSGVQEKGAGKDETLPIPDALFVWSFYKHPDVDRCATELYNYLTEEQVRKATFDQIQELLSKNYRGCRVLLVFDGVEKIQIAPGIEPEEEGGTFGQFRPEGAPLARFLSWCCDGPRPVYVLITSRFGLTDLRRYGTAGGGYRAVDLGDLPLESARALLRAAGVKGLDRQLDDLIQEFDNHAQTLDLLGNALRIWCDGDPTRVNELPSLEDVKKLAGIRDKVWGRVRVLRFYEERLPKEALRLLQLMCAFEVMPVAAETLAGVARIVAKSAPDVFGVLAGLSSQGANSHLISLEYEYHLAYSAIGKSGSRTYFVHRAIQDYFWGCLPWDAKDVVHKQIVDFLASLEPLASLIERIKDIRGTPVYFAPVEETYIDELEELIRHLVEVNDFLKLEFAWDLYFFGLGAFEQLGVKLGLYSRGERLAQLFADVQFESLIWSIYRTGIPLGDLQILLRANRTFHKLRSEFLNERGIYALSLGELRIAVTSYREAVELAVELQDLKNALIYCANLCEGYLLQGRLPKAVSIAAYGLETAESGAPNQPLTTYRGDETWVAGGSGHTLLNRPELLDQLWILSSYAAYALVLRGQHAAGKERFVEALQYFYLASTRPELAAVSAVLAPLVDALGGQRIAPPDLTRLALGGKLYSIAGVYEAAWMIRLGNVSKSCDILIDNRNMCEKIGLNRDVSRCDLLLSEVQRLQRELSQARESLTRALDWGTRTADQEALVWGNLICARLALDAGELDKAERAIREGLQIAEYCGYGLYWIDLQVAKGQWALARGALSQACLSIRQKSPDALEWFERAEASALRALNGQLKDSSEPASQADLPEEKFSMLGARHPECGYAWGEGDALHLLGEAMLALAQYVGPHGHDSKGRSHKELLEKARQAAEAALALRKRIQDPKVKDTQDLLSKIEEAQGGGKS